MRPAGRPVLPADTIVAIATPPGVGAIGVIRVSGPQAIDRAAALLRLAQARDLRSARPRTLYRARVVEPGTGSEIDEALIAVMPGPRSYTGEDVVEISGHGSPVTLGEIVRILVAGGARLAEPGEFTRRAYLNGRLDLVQAEAVALLIGARTERAGRLAARQIAGALSAELNAVREAALNLIAGLEVALDFPEDEVGVSPVEALARSEEMSAQLGRLSEDARRGRDVQEGLSVMLAGAPNVGKSSLLNALLGRDRAIVSALPGTTRDLLEGSVVVEGVPVRLMDGAGLGQPRHSIDAEGMRRSAQAVATSDLVIVVLDRSRPLTAADREVLRLTSGRERVLVGNKSDLPSEWSEETAECACSALTGMGLAELQGRLEMWVKQRTAADAEEGGVVASLRVVEQLDRGRTALDRATLALRAGLPLEVVLVDLREALLALDQTLGIEADDALLDRIFATFCVGK